MKKGFSMSTDKETSPSFEVLPIEQIGQYQDRYYHEVSKEALLGVVSNFKLTCYARAVQRQSINAKSFLHSNKMNLT
jgi:hypothetical protein